MKIPFISGKTLSRNLISTGVLLAAVALLLIWYARCLPDPLFDVPYATVIEDRNGVLLGARIAADGQWRFPPGDSIPGKFTKALLLFEDHSFYHHPGVNPLALLKAIWVNLKAGKVIRGGSTLTMQMIRLSDQGKPRTGLQKIKEIILATRAEWRYTKDEILEMYTAHAPFGGNVVGLEAASWKYYGREAPELSWAEAATLAVLPNAPSMIHPGRNRQHLLDKRNRLLLRLHQHGYIDAITYQLALAESLPDAPLALPQEAPHLLDRVWKTKAGVRLKTTLDANLQGFVNETLDKHRAFLEANQIFNAAALILDVESGGVLAYAGNFKDDGNPDHGRAVDIITAPRSTGSILKPLLYAAMLHDGAILPNTLVPDVPTFMEGFAPENYNRGFDGAVQASRALSRSLNVPAVWMLKEYGIPKFYNLLKELGMNTLVFPSSHYGLSLILGGAEGSLWDISGIYASLSRLLSHYPKIDGMYFPGDISSPGFHLDKQNLKEAEWKTRNKQQRTGKLSAATVWLTYKAMLEVGRPDILENSHLFSSSQMLAWKTGTSYGNRDAWAIGTNPRYVVGVWVGNADGSGRPNLSGIGSAAPILFDLFGGLPPSSWFRQPLDDMVKIATCRQSGCRAGLYCEEVDSIWVQSSGLRTQLCHNHILIHLNAKGERVNSDCASPFEMTHRSWFVLPPIQAYYYMKKNLSYKPLPPMSKACSAAEERIIGLIYPRQNARIYVPIEITGLPGKVVFEAVHREADVKLFWHLDETYMGMSQYIHQMAFRPDPGKHNLLIVDEYGNRLSRNFEILPGKEDSQRGLR